MYSSADLTLVTDYLSGPDFYEHLDTSSLRQGRNAKFNECTSKSVRRV